MLAVVDTLCRCKWSVRNLPGGWRSVGSGSGDSLDGYWDTKGAINKGKHQGCIVVGEEGLGCGGSVMGG